MSENTAVPMPKFKFIKVTQPTTLLNLNAKPPQKQGVQPAPKKKMIDIIPQEIAIKRNLIKELRTCGVTFNEPMLKAINEFFTSTTLIFKQQIETLANDKQQLEEQVHTLQERIATFSTQHNSKAKKLEAANNTQENGLLLGLKHLGNKFILDIEQLIQMQSVQNENISENASTLTKSETLKNSANKLLAEESFEKIIQELLNRLDANNPNVHLELNRCKESVSKLVMALMPLENIAFDDNCLIGDNGANGIITDGIGMIQAESGPERSVLLGDVHMGIKLPVPPLMPVHNGFGKQKQSNNNYAAMQKFCTYLRTCDMHHDNGDRPIHREVFNNNEYEVKRQCVALYLKQVSLDIFNEDGYTPLHLAVMYDASLQIILTLRRYGAEFGTCDSAGNNILHLAVEHNTLSKVLDESLLKTLDVTLMSKLKDEYNNEGYTPLHLAAMQGKSDDVTLLIRAKVNLNASDKKSGRTALYHAIENDYIDVVKLLMQNDADTHVRTYADITIVEALYEADSDFSPDMKKLFYEDRMEIAAHKNALEERLLQKQTLKRSGNATYGNANKGKRKKK